MTKSACQGRTAGRSIPRIGLFVLLKCKKEEGREERGRIVPDFAVIVVIATLCIFLTGIWQMKEEVGVRSRSRSLRSIETTERF